MTKLHGQFHIVKLMNVDVIYHTHRVKEKSPVIVSMAARKDSANFIYCLLKKKKTNLRKSNFSQPLQAVTIMPRFLCIVIFNILTILNIVLKSS